MGRAPRYIPENTVNSQSGGVLVEVTCRTVEGRALLVPAPNPRLFNEMVLGVMGRAREISPLEICSAIMVSNHLHFLLVVRTQQELSRFMQHFLCNLTKEVNRLRGRRGSLWERRYDSVIVSDDPQDQWRRLEYLLSHGVKEGLCLSPLDWPGVHTARQLARDEKLEGVWLNRCREWAARNRGDEVQAYDYATRYEIELSPLPAFRDLGAEEYQAKVVGLVHKIEKRYEQERGGEEVAGEEKILSQNPFERPTNKEPKRSPRPWFHVSDRELRKEMWTDFRYFLAHYYDASDRLRLSERLPEACSWFPDGCYPPALPFNGEPAPPRPPAPPTRRIERLETGEVIRGEIPVVVLAAKVWSERGSPASLTAG